MDTGNFEDVSRLDGKTLLLPGRVTNHFKTAKVAESFFLRMQNNKAHTIYLDATRTHSCRKKKRKEKAGIKTDISPDIFPRILRAWKT